MILAPLPFIVELIADYLLIKAGRKDLNIYVRALMIVVVALVWLWITGDWRAALSVGVLACAPFAFFDQALNLLRFGWKQWKAGKWAYVSSTNGKWFDKQFAKINPYWLLVGRCLLFVGLIFGWITI